MPNVLKHKFTSGVVDSANTALVRPVNWNDEHLFAGGTDGQVLTWDAALSDKVKWAHSTNEANVKNYGATGDGVTNDLAAIKLARDSLSSGGTLYFPPGTYAIAAAIPIFTSNIRIRGAGMGASRVKGIAGILTTHGLIMLGYDDAIAPVPISNVVVEDITLDGMDLARPLMGTGVTNLLVSRVYCENSTRAPAQFFDCVDVTVEHCILTDSNATDQFGDGLYFGGCTRPKALYNHIWDFKRIGIVTEENGAVKSSDALVLGNVVHNAHDASGAESNAGIWLENTNGGEVIGNRLFDLNTNPGANGSRGIVISVGSSVPSWFHCSGNYISEAQYGFIVQADKDVNVSIKGNRVEKGTLSAYISGVHITQGCNVDIDDLSCGTNTFAVGVGGCVTADVSNAGFGMEGIRISNVRAGDATAAMGYATDSADINFWATTAGISSLTLENLRQLRVNMRQPVSRVIVNCCELTHDALTYKMLNASFRLQVSNSLLGGVGTLTPHWLGETAGSVGFFSNTVFNAMAMYISNAGANLQYWRFSDCYFIGDSQLIFDGDHDLFMSGCRFNQYPDDGAILGNKSVNTLNIILHSCQFFNDTDVTPVQLDTVQPTLLLMEGILRNATTLTDMTPAITGYTYTAVVP